ncbi:MAG: heme-binding protein, partial [Planctomycetota bacterium]
MGKKFVGQLEGCAVDRRACGWKRLGTLIAAAVTLLGVHGPRRGAAQDLEQGIALELQLRSEDPQHLVAEATEHGNPARGAILFHGPMLGCGKCHSVSDTGPDLLGPNLAAARPDETPQRLVESILSPSARIAEAFRSARVLTEDGQVITGMPIASASDENTLVLRHLETLQDIRIPRDEIAQMQWSQQSVMPDGLVRGLANRQEFLDLLRYLVEIREGGPRRARELQPTAAQLAIRLPDYESDIDHAGMIRDLDKAALGRGEKIYNSLCINCHGTLTQRGSLDTALRFGEGKFKHGSDPYSIYQTLTRGAGLMLPQPWMVPQQKYDVIHYIRERFLKPHNPSQYFQITESYLDSLPRGTQRGPEPQPIEPWSQADYGPRLVNTYEIGSGGRNIAQKGIAVQLDDQPGGVAHGRAWAVFEHDTMRLAGVWTSRGFIDWQGIHFNGRHGIHPHVVGDILLANPTAPGWADPDTGDLQDNARVVGRDGKRYGPLPRRWAQFRGFHQLGRNTVIEYQVGQTPVLETYRWSDTEDWETPLSGGLFRRLLRLGSRPKPLRMVVATLQ